jgi:hypothetical protein
MSSRDATGWKLALAAAERLSESTSNESDMLSLVDDLDLCDALLCRAQQLNGFLAVQVPFRRKG